MYGRICQWPAWTLAVVFTCGACGVALAQGDVAPMLGTDPGYQMGVDSTYAVPGYPTPPRNAYPVSSNFSADEAGLAAEVAGLKADLKKIQDKNAAAEKKAAGRPSVKVGGRINWDLAVYDQDVVSLAHPYGNLQNGSEFRRARIFLKGDAFHVLDYKLQFDFAESDAAFRDAYITVKELPLLQHVRFGQFKEPFGLEQLGNANYLTFMERSLCDEGTFVPARKTGVMTFGHSAGENFTWAIACRRGRPPGHRGDDARYVPAVV